MLQDTATVAGDVENGAAIVRGHFSFVVDGAQGRLDPLTYRKFITALWCVYYSETSPGISIDPIAPDVDKHLVRYIGKVTNTDLGRVMREADYLMKKWAVGIEKPSYPGFACVDDLMARVGFRFVGVSRRFWFIPEDMIFKRADDLLMYVSGRMVLKTEYCFQDKPAKAEPADEAFAKYFTDHYADIAKLHPVYAELFEYAKLVSLAKYLKENNVPLYWFLIANKHLVLTEDSPGTVNELAKGSRHFEGMTIKGGVDLNVQGRYVIDETAIQAVREARARMPAAPAASEDAPMAKRSAVPPAPVTLDLGSRRYTVLPQQALVAGNDRQGIRYQTDVAVRSGAQPGLEVARFHDPRRPEGGEFGQGWRLLVPYRVKPADAEMIPFLNVRIPKRMTIENQLTGANEVLTFSADRYAAAGYIPADLKDSQVIGLFLMSDASFRLADKLGNEFHFAGDGRLTEMAFSEAHRMSFEYTRGFSKDFDKAPYRVEPAGREKVDFLNVHLPRRMEVKDLVHGQTETLVFNPGGRIAGYVPEAPVSSRVEILALRSDASFQLLDKKGNEVAFDPAGRFVGMKPGEPMVQSVTDGAHTVTFTFDVDRTGAMRIAGRRMAGPKGESAPRSAMGDGWAPDRCFPLDGGDPHRMPTSWLPVVVPHG